MDKKYVILVLIFTTLTSIFAIDFDVQKSQRDSVLKSIYDDKVIINKKKYFEDIPWGTNIENVKKMEDRVLLNETINELDFQVSIDSITAILVYGFKEDRLDSVMLILREEDNYDVYNVEYSDILFNLVSEMELNLGKAIYSDTLREKDIKRYPTNNPNLINSINFIWNFTNTRVSAIRTNAPGIPVMITYKSKGEYDIAVNKEEIDLNEDEGFFFKYKGMLGFVVIFLLSFRVFARVMRARKQLIRNR